jgi:glycerol-3-phosphate cytidylyltransferase
LWLHRRYTSEEGNYLQSTYKLLKHCKQLGDYLIVGLSTDEFNLMKNKIASYSYNHRKYIIESIKQVDEVIPESGWE